MRAKWLYMHCWHFLVLLRHLAVRTILVLHPRGCITVDTAHVSIAIAASVGSAVATAIAVTVAASISVTVAAAISVTVAAAICVAVAATVRSAATPTIDIHAVSPCCRVRAQG